MASGNIEIKYELRPCIVHIPEKREYFRENRERKYRIKKTAENIKALFHCWNHRSELVGGSSMTGGHPGGQVSGTFAIVEYEDGTVHEVEPQNIRFVDNAMSEYVFPEMEKNIDKVKNEWKPLKRVNHVCPKCGQGRMKLDEGIVLTSNPPQYRYQCDKCGYVECSSGQIEVSEIDEYEP